MPKPRQPLNELQTEILLILYKFRFATKDLIVSYQQLPSKSYTQARLKNLLEQEYIARHYNGKDKIAGKPAIYYLAPKGIRFLLGKPELELNPKVLNLTYKDKGAGEDFIDQCLTIFKLYNVLTSQYGSALDFYTRSETADYTYVLKSLTAALLMFSGKYKQQPDCILELMSSAAPYFTLRRRMSQYYNHYSSNVWQNETGSEYPRLLLVTDSPNLERRLQKSIARSLDERGISKLEVYMTTVKALENMDGLGEVWTDVTKPGVLVSLSPSS